MAGLLIPTAEFFAFQHLCQKDVHIWFFDLSQYSGVCASLAALLSTDEQSRAASFAFERDCHNFTLSHGLLRVILAQYLGEEPRHIQFENGVYGKPSVFSQSRGAQSIQFSLSHSMEHAIMAVTMGRAVGVDLELCRPDLDFLQLAQKFFAPSESRQIAQAHGEGQNRMFYRYWTAKEAYLKGRGVGLSLGLDWFELLFNELLTGAQVRFIESGAIDEDWLVQPLQITDQLAGALAVEGEALRIQIFNATASLFR